MLKYRDIMLFKFKWLFRFWSVNRDRTANVILISFQTVQRAWLSTVHDLSWTLHGCFWVFLALKSSQRVVNCRKRSCYVQKQSEKLDVHEQSNFKCLFFKLSVKARLGLLFEIAVISKWDTLIINLSWKCVSANCNHKSL
jgi:hypothetical protein